MNVELTEEQIDKVANQVASIVSEKLQKHKPKDTLSAQAVADYIGVSKMTVYRNMVTDDFTLPRKIGKLLSFDRKEVDAWFCRGKRKKVTLDLDHRLNAG